MIQLRPSETMTGIERFLNILKILMFRRRNNDQKTFCASCVPSWGIKMQQVHE